MNKGRYFGKFFIVFLLLVNNIAWAAAQNAQLTAISVASTNNKTQIVLTLTGKVAYKIFNLINPDRLAIDLTNVKLATSLTKVNLANTPLIKLRQGQPNANTIRIVFDLKQKQQMSVEALANEQKLIVHLAEIPGTGTTHPTINQTALQQTSTWAAETLPQDDDGTKATTTIADQIDNELSQASTATPQTETKPESKSEPKLKPIPKPTLIPVIEKPITPEKTGNPTKTALNITTPNEPIEISTPIASVSNLKGQRTITVVIDPGHGGKDPGTMGSMGVREKDVVLGISKQVQELLNKENGFRAVLTRNDDYFIPLRGRLNIARKDRGDMFVAVHADAYVNSYAGGASVFTLSAHGASSEAARWLAEKENTSELGGVSLHDKSNVLRSVLIDLSQTATITSSMQSGKSVLRQLSRVSKLHRGFVEQAPFMVLKNPDIPSMLVETGFLSNPMEEQRLRDPYYQRKIAAAIVDGIKDYFYNNPPPGTMIASIKQNKNVS